MHNHIKLIQEITEYINVNYGTINSVEDIASNFYISTSYVRKLYKKYTGKTIFAVLYEKRMEEAKRMLAYPDARVYEVAEKVGYNGKRYFINAFRDYTGMSPKEYQKLYFDKGDNIMLNKK